MHTSTTVTAQAMGELTAELAILKGRVNEFNMAGGRGPAEQYELSSGGSDRGPRIQPRPVRVPDIGSWKLSVFQNNDQGGFIEWRKSLDTQLGNVWPGLDLLLEDIRDDKDPIVEARFDELVQKHELITAYSHPEDWKFTRLMRHLHTVIYTYIGADPRKVIAENSSRNGFDQYRLLHKEFDAVNTGSKFQMYQHCMAVGGWPVKGLAQLVQAIRELAIRIATYEKRTNFVFANEQATGIMFQLLTKDGGQVHELKRADALEDFAKMKKTLIEMNDLHASSKPRPMQLDYASEKPEEAIWDGQIEYNDFVSGGGAPDDWSFYPYEGEAATEPAWEEPALSLDALGRKGGKKGSKGGKKGGKAKGKGGKATPPAAGGAWVEQRQCYNCLEYGHIAQSGGEWKCPKPDKRKAGKSLKSAVALAAAAGSEASAAAAGASAAPLAPATVANGGFCMLRQLPRKSPVDMHVHDSSFAELVCGVCEVDNSAKAVRAIVDEVGGELVVDGTSNEYIHSNGEPDSRLEMMETSAESITNDEIVPSLWSTIGNQKSKYKMPRIERPITRNNQASGSKHFPLEFIEREFEQVVPSDERLHRGGGERRTAQSLAGSKTSIPNFSMAKSTHSHNKLPCWWGKSCQGSSTCHGCKYRIPEQSTIHHFRIYDNS